MNMSIFFFDFVFFFILFEDFDLMNTCSLEAKIAELQQENMMLHSLIAKSANAAGMDADANPDCEFL